MGIALIALVLGACALGATLVAEPKLIFAGSFDAPWPVFVLLFAFAQHRSVDFEYRKEVHSFSLSQIPVAFATVLVAPGFHLLARVLATVIDCWALRRQRPLKVVFNVAVSAFESAIAVLLVGALASNGAPGPSLWLALVVAAVFSEAVTSLSISVVMRLTGARVTRDGVLQPLFFATAGGVFLTAVSVVALSAVWTEPLALIIILLLAVALTAAYRGHRRTVAQQHTTERLYDFVKGLGPLTLDAPESRSALEQVRLLLGARHLELALTTPDGLWRRLSVADGDVVPTEASSAAVRVPDGPVLEARPGGTDRMTTPITGATGLLGTLTATGRLNAARDYDMKDLRILETIATELGIALERGGLLRDLAIAATTDVLTGLNNLTELTRLLNEEMAQRPEGILLAAVAVDSFREVNDTLGHQVGDDLLIEVTRRLHLASPDALIGRIGGGRFAVAVDARSFGGDPEMFGLGLRASAEGSCQLGPVGTHIRLSVGCARGPEHGTDAATLLRRAETAMYGARTAQGGPVLWEPAYEVRGQRRLAVVMALREALASGAIGVAFQPKIDALTGRVQGVEALARWTHPALGAISPDEFIPLAEASGLMGPLTSTILRQALTACKGWQRRAGHVGVAVNVSAETVLDPSFVTEVAAILTSTGVAPGVLTLELTEGVVVEDPQLAADRMQELRALGVLLSVDDFGTGYSSLTYLKGLPVDEVKVDKGFVRNLVHDPADRAVVRAVVDIAHTLGMKVVAEGVEQEDQQQILRLLGVDELQGYLFARPMPAVEMAGWLRRREAARVE